jgi:hypothetical protein
MLQLEMQVRRSLDDVDIYVCAMSHHESWNLYEFEGASSVNHCASVSELKNCFEVKNEMSIFHLVDAMEQPTEWCSICNPNASKELPKHNLEKRMSMWKRNPLLSESESQEQEVPGDGIMMSEILGECKLGWLTNMVLSVICKGLQLSLKLLQMQIFKITMLHVFVIIIVKWRN